ncbi:MAG: hypothetical protein QM679_04735 [Patulibacter sp.]
MLDASDEPMSPAQIHLAVGVKLDQHVSKSTIKNELRRRLRVLGTELAQHIDGGYSLGAVGDVGRRRSTS